MFFSVTEVSAWLISEEDSVASLGTEASLSIKDPEVLSVSCIKAELKEELSGVSPVLQPPINMETAVNPAIIPIIALSLVIITIIPLSLKCLAKRKRLKSLCYKSVNFLSSCLHLKSPETKR